MTDTSTPARIGKYRVIASLGQGGMARVFLGLTQGPGGFSKLLVLKEIRAELAADVEFQQMFLTEARIAARLNHGNVVHTYEVGEEDGRCFMAMEYLEGQPLSALIARLRKKGLSADLQIWILAQTLAGLHYAHELVDLDGTRMEVIHRDVSPPNIFVTYEGAVKLLDFGIAKVAGSDGNTRAGTFKGKLAYAAPEQIQAMPLDRRADIFAVGVMLWEVLAKRRMTQGEDDIAIFGSRLSGKHPDLLAAAPDTPPELVAICARAMAHVPADRYATAADFQGALEQWLDGKASRSWSKELATTLSTAFAQERAKIRGQVEQQVKLAGEVPESKPLSVVVLADDAEAAVPLPTPSEGSQIPAPSDAVYLTPPSGADTRPPISVTANSVAAPLDALVSPEAPSGSFAPTAAAGTNKLLIGAGVIIAVLVFALGFTLRGGGADTARVTTAAVTSAAVTTAAPSAPLALSTVPAASAAASTTTQPPPAPVPDAAVDAAAVPTASSVGGPPVTPGAKGKRAAETGMGAALPGPENKPPKGRRTIDSKDPYAQ